MSFVHFEMLYQNSRGDIVLQILQTKHIENYWDKLNEMGLGELYPNVVEATDNDNIIGTGVYHFDNEFVVIDEINSNGDLYIYDGIVRAILFLAMMKGYDVARFDLKDLSDVKKLGFVQNNDNILTDLNGFMKKCKSCGK